MELLHRRCCGLDVHKETVVACLCLMSDGKVTTEARTFQTTADLLRLSEWLATNECTHVAMEAIGSTGSRCGTSWMMVSSSWYWQTPRM